VLRAGSLATLGSAETTLAAVHREDGEESSEVCFYMHDRENESARSIYIGCSVKPIENQKHVVCIFNYSIEFFSIVIVHFKGRTRHVYAVLNLSLLVQI
jgi:hypothetical protein